MRAVGGRGREGKGKRRRRGRAAAFLAAARVTGGHSGSGEERWRRTRSSGTGCSGSGVLPMPVRGERRGGRGYCSSCFSPFERIIPDQFAGYFLISDSEETSEFLEVPLITLFDMPHETLFLKKRQNDNTF
jgi:hypothetical protein